MVNINILKSAPDPVEPREPHPFSPDWRVTIGPVIFTGDGILSKEVWAQKDLIDTFELLFKGVTVKLDLRNGSIWFCPYGAEPQCQHHPNLPRDTKFRLIWFRRMRKEMFTEDKNTAAFECLYYGFGWQTTINGKNERFGYTIKPDSQKEGSFYPGLPNGGE